MNFAPLIAAIRWKSALGMTSPTVKEYLILFGGMAVVTLVTAVVLILIAQYRRRHPRKRRHSHRHRDEASASVPKVEQEVSRKLRRRRREHRPRNPTLAETGGLPPLRSERPLDPNQPRVQLW